MRRVALFLAACVAVVSAAGLYAQQAELITSTNNTAGVSQSVPRLIMFSGTVRDLAGKPMTGPVDLNFAIYKEQTDAAPLWQETQTLNVDEQGHYAALLGAMQAEGLPVDLFTSGEARWLGLSVGKLPEQPRVLLVSVPYALKANDAEMLGGKPASAYALAPPADSATSQGPGAVGTTGPRGAASSELAAPANPKSGPKPNVAGTGTQNYIPVWTNSTGTLGNSVIYQSSGLLGIGTTTPGGKLDVAGSVGHFQVDTSGAQFRFSRGGANYFLASTAGGYFDFVANGLTPSDANASLKLAANGVVNFMAGNVGIGTLTPAQKLDVTGNIHTSGNVAATGSVTAASFAGSGAGLTTLNASNLASGTVPSTVLSGTYSNALAFSSAGNSFTGNGSGLTGVAASTATTASGLSCTGCVGNTQLGVNYATSSSKGGAASNALLLNGYTSSAFQPAGSYAVTTGPNSFTGTQTVSSGMLGIGTTGPVSPLNVSGTTGLTWIGGGTNLGLATLGTPGTGGSLYLNTPSGSSTYQSGLGIDGTYGTPSQQSVINLKALGVKSGGGYGSQLAFWTANGTALNQQMTIDMNGNVGVGTATPAAKLEVNGTAKFDGVVTFAGGQTFPGAGGGTVTSIATGPGLTGGPITTSGTISIPPSGVSNSMLANPSLAVNTNSGLTGGGQVYLGESLTLGMVSSACSPGMAVTALPGPNCLPFAGFATNSFYGPQTINVGSGTGLMVNEAGGGTAIQAISGAGPNNGVAAHFMNTNGGTILEVDDGSHTIFSADTYGVDIRRTVGQFTNDPTTATVLYELVGANQSTGNAKLAGPGFLGLGALGIAIAQAGTSAQYPETIVAMSGETQCVFDNTAVNYDFFQVSPTTAGKCHDAGPNYPAVGQVLGVVTDATKTPPEVFLIGLGTGVQTGVIATNAVCASSLSPAACGGDGAGFVAIAGGTTTLVVDTFAVTANSQIMLQEDSSLGTKLGVTCNTTLGRTYTVSARTPGTSFTIAASSAPATNPACVSYVIVN